ncbi:MAG: flavin reductase family protein [Alphaproteobacteria bacterium]
MNPDSNSFRKGMSQFATGVAVVTVPVSEDKALGVTINSFTSVSLDPPLILYCMKRTAEAYANLIASPFFGVSILSDKQELLARRCTQKGGGELTDLEFFTGHNDCPLIKNAAANFVCDLHHLHSGGDHSVILGQVLDVNFDESISPLAFHRSQFWSMNTCQPLPQVSNN